ncbi:hypothetical protein PIROE2DRAFT_17585 [Piromyces sp. E2]|nr:hypothetical protein PIROE2DRAFT_17585 [Piromyces sp. E2]|eukprot:OUM57441.1 hypothetical protein PIROE2DRAFT_17585 [Piromyces sp. E2]
MKILQLISIYAFAVLTASAYYISQQTYTNPETKFECLDDRYYHSEVTVSLPPEKVDYFLYYESGWFNKGHRVTFSNCELIYNFFDTQLGNGNKYPPRIECIKSNDSKYPEITIKLQITNMDSNFLLDHFVVSEITDINLYDYPSEAKTKQICDAKKQSINNANLRYFIFDVKGFEYKGEGDKFVRIQKTVTHKKIHGIFQYENIIGCKKK